MTIDYRVISIGTLAAHPLWDERNEQRTGHATTTLIQHGGTKLVIDPGLPGPMMEARLGERTNTRPEQITHVFLTRFDADHVRGLDRFPNAQWMVHEPEREFARAMIESRIAEAESTGDADLVAVQELNLDLLDRTVVAPDHIALGIDLFPLPGVTPGTCGILLPLPTISVLVSGDAVATTEHLIQGKILPGCADVELAQESFTEAIEIADVIILGRGNVELNPLRPGMT